MSGPAPTSTRFSPRSGVMIVVVGPSGAGKDSIMNFAASRFRERDDVHFVRRVITRDSDAGGENHDAVSDEAFENETPNDEDPDVRARACQEEYDQRRGGVFVTMLDGRPAASGGLTFYPDDRLVLLWGGSSTKAARGRGAYRANLLARLRRAHQLGYAHAVVKGRVTTSAAILTRVGFVDLGQERVVALDVQASSSPST